MTTRFAASVCVFAVVAAVAASASAEEAPAAAASPRYALAIQSELSAIGVNARCEPEAKGRYHCAWPLRVGSPATDLMLHAVYSQESDGIYFYIERFLVLAPEAAQTNATLKRLMELNWEMLVGKFEWNPHSGEVRVSAVLATDSNFDRRAFRSIVRALDAIALRYHRELHE
jgi:hypothetical protein